MTRITDAYIECALWTSEDELEGATELTDEAREQIDKECADFLAYCETAGVSTDGWDDSQLGHDFWLTRNHHGAGFWDRGLPGGDELTAAAHTFGTSDLYVGDDNLIHVS